MSKYEVKKLDKKEYDLWDQVVKKSSFSTIYHDIEWLKNSEKLLKKELKIYGFFKKNEIIGGCPLFIRNNYFFKRANSNCEMNPYSGILWCLNESNSIRKNEKIQREIIRSFSKKILDDNKSNVFLVINTPGIKDIRPFIWDNWTSNVLYTYLLNLNNLNYSKDVDRNIKKAEKNEIKIKRSDDIDKYYELFKETFQDRQGLNTPVSKKYLETMYHMLLKKKRGEMWFALTSDSELAAAEIFTFDKKYPNRWTAATSTKHRKTGAYFYLLDTIFKEFKNKGYNQINLLSANTVHLASFITAFNPYIKPYYVVKLRRKNIFSKTKDFGKNFLKKKLD